MTNYYKVSPFMSDDHPLDTANARGKNYNFPFLNFTWNYIKLR